MIDQTQSFVSVIMITYKHELFLLEAINGVLDQSCDFNVELIIADDCSPDKTQNIVESFRNHKNYNRIKYSRHPTNIGMTANFISALQKVTSKYIALCEGDDFWTDFLKLQKQIDFLESNPEYSYCFHDSIILNQITGTSQLRVGQRKIDEIVDLKSLISENNIATASIVFRNCIDWSNLPGWFLKTPKGDYALVVLLAEKGLGKYITDPMSVYRVHEGGVWSGKAESDYHILENINFFKELFFYFTNNSTKGVIRVRLGREYVNHSLLKIRQGMIFRGLLVYAANGGVGVSQLKKQKIRKLLGAIRTGVVYKMNQVRFGQP